MYLRIFAEETLGVGVPQLPNTDVPKTTTTTTKTTTKMSKIHRKCFTLCHNQVGTATPIHLQSSGMKWDSNHGP